MIKKRKDCKEDDKGGKKENAKIQGKENIRKRIIQEGRQGREG